MRFSPHRTVSNTSYEAIDPDYDSLSSSDEENEQGNPFIINSSPLKALETPSKKALKSFTKIRSPSLYRSFHSSPLGRSEPHSAESSFAKESDIEDQLTDLFKDLKFKERYQLVSSHTVKRADDKSKSRPGSRHKRNQSVTMPNSSPLKNDTIDVDGMDDGGVASVASVAKAQENVVSGLEYRLLKRAKEVEDTVKQIEEERRRLEEEKRRQEEERERKAEEERKRKEEEEKKKKEAEEKKKKEAEERKKQEELQKKKEEEERLKKEAEERAKQEAKAKLEREAKAKKDEEDRLEAEKKQNDKHNGFTHTEEIKREFKHYKQMIKDIKANILEPVKQNKDLKMATSKHKRKVNPKFGQLTNSMSQLSRISNEVIQLINEAKGNELAYKWILNFVAKAIVSQSETEVRAKPSASLPLAKLTLNLLCEFEELKELLIARFVKKCPYIIGYAHSDVDTEQGRLEMGWRRNSDTDKWEDQESYNERMCGMVTLYIVITRLVLDPKYYQIKKHPLPISQSWQFITRLLNSDQLSNTHFNIACSWWEANVGEFLQSYGKQGNKILECMITEWPKRLEGQNVVYTGAKTLLAIGEDWRTGVIKKFDEMEP